MKIATLQWAVAMFCALNALAAIVRVIDEFWFSVVGLPRD